MEKGVALSPRLAVLLERKSKGGAMKGLERRLAQTLRGARSQARGVAGGWSREEGLTILMEIGDGAEATATQEGGEEQKACA